MNDVFYFSTAVVELEEVRDLAVSLGYLEKYLSGSALQLEMKRGAKHWCEWSCFDLDDAEPEERAELEGEGIRTSFCITHHSMDLPDLVRLLTSVIEKCGGWVGTDADRFAPRYELVNISELALPQVR